MPLSQGLIDIIQGAPKTQASFREVTSAFSMPRLSKEEPSRVSEIFKSQGQLRTRRSLALAITMTALAALALIANALLTVANVRRVRDAEKWVAHTHQVLDTLRSLQSSVADAETGQRGFLITGRATYLEPYEAGRSAVQQRL